jgi:TetR/AcrR family transcriptional repressor of nem operon
MAKRTSRQSLKKRRTHDRIIAAAGRIARKNGLAAASVSRVMHGAGLTIGGFYAHFRSKRAMDAEVVQATLGGSSSVPVPWSIDRYLSAAHRDDAEHGCAFPAMLSEIARADEPTRLAMARAIDARARELAKALPGGRGAAARQRALATLAICVGGLTLARAMRGHKASDEVLAACRKWAHLDRRSPPTNSRPLRRPAVR